MTEDAAQPDEQVAAGINRESVEAWFGQNIDGVQLPLSFELLAGGHSNLTFRVTDAAETDYVLRRPPLGHVLATAHDMEREHRIISGVGKTSVPVPAALGLCTDITVNDAPFYVMDHVVGTVLHTDEEVAGMSDIEKVSLSRRVVEVLADLHAVEPSDIGLGELGKREDYIARQLRRWTKQWVASKTRELPEMACLQIDQVSDAMPLDDRCQGRPVNANLSSHLLTSNSPFLRRFAQEFANRRRAYHVVAFAR